MSANCFLDGLIGCYKLKIVFAVTADMEASERNQEKCYQKIYQA